jgi:hypothetical protein
VRLAGLVVVAAVATVVRLAFLYRAPVFLTGDSQSHYLPGFDLAFGAGFDPELRRTPGYPLFVAGVIGFLGEDLRALAFAQHCLGVATAVLTYALGRLTFGWVAGLLAGLLVALDGALILSEHSMMTETLFGTLLVATLAALLAGHRTGRWGWYLLGGLLLGMAALTRPVAQILVFVVPAVLVLLAALNGRGRNDVPRSSDVPGSSVALIPALSQRERERVRFAGLRRGLGAGLWACVVVGVGFSLMVGPWTVRNLAEHGSLTASGGLGRSLVARTIKYDQGYFDEDRVVADDDLKGQVYQFVRGKRNTIRNSRSVRSTQAGLMKEFGLTQAESDGLMRQVALEAISERPGYYAVGSLKMAGQILVGKEKEDALETRWTQRTQKDWAEQWEARIDHLATPTSPSEHAESGKAERLANLYQPSELGPIMPALALIGLVMAVVVPSFRPALLVGLSMAALVLASAALDGPVPRYRYPVDPLIALLAAGAVVGIARYLPLPLRRRRASGLPRGEDDDRGGIRARLDPVPR